MLHFPSIHHVIEQIVGLQLKAHATPLDNNLNFRYHLYEFFKPLAALYPPSFPNPLHPGLTKVQILSMDRTFPVSKSRLRTVAEKNICLQICLTKKLNSCVNAFDYCMQVFENIRSLKISFLYNFTELS